MLAPDFVAVMVCPKSKQPLVYFPRGEDDRDERDGFLFCPTSRLRYRIEEGLPVLLVSEASEVSPTDAARLESRAQALGIAKDAGHRGA